MSNYVYVDSRGNIMDTISDPTPKDLELSINILKRGVQFIIPEPIGYTNPKWNKHTEEWYEYQEVSDLDKAKTRKIEEIDLKTREILDQGFMFDNQQFSLSPNAQLNWTGLHTAVQSGLITESDFPFEIITIDDMAYNLSWENSMSFFGLVLQTINVKLSEGRSLKTQVKSATTIEQLNSIIDNR